MKTALLALALVAVTATAAPVRKPAFALSKIRALVSAPAANSTNATAANTTSPWKIYYDYADYMIWDENQTDYYYKNSKGSKIKDDNSAWTYTAYATYWYGKSWETNWKFGKFWYVDYCDTEGCDEKYPEIVDVEEDESGAIMWVNQFSDADWKKYGPSMGFTKQEFQEYFGDYIANYDDWRDDAYWQQIPARV